MDPKFYYFNCQIKPLDSFLHFVLRGLCCAGNAFGFLVFINHRSMSN